MHPMGSRTMKEGRAKNGKAGMIKKPKPLKGGEDRWTKKKQKPSDEWKEAKQIIRRGHINERPNGKIKGMLRRKDNKTIMEGKTR